VGKNQASCWLFFSIDLLEEDLQNGKEGYNIEGN
jgi:hypothetical protein